MEVSPNGNGERSLPSRHASLAYGVPPSPVGTIYALAISGGITLRPKEGRSVLFGRNRPEVHVCLGEDDRRVSRNHGSLTFRTDRWWVANTGRVPLRLPNSRLLFSQDEPVPLTMGYTPVFVRGSGGREHLLEVYVAGPEEPKPCTMPDEATQPPRCWALAEPERLALTVLGQRYLLHEVYPQPLTWHQAAAELADLRPNEEWSSKRVERMVSKVRARMSRRGVAGLTRDEVGEPVGNTLNHNLIRELMESTTLVPTDLRLLEG
ncbi:MAG TPA: hypothetical protein VE172_14780 [Stackebrandtia sp.]|uniref:hypothetical protein n=1 Tax=Stackebrandtia sp. TaxID=2023065 RepID=UPI002D4013C3|nr:hypothetical protein [Stackebrandtia sp.]HZE40069.1 hypothetical protein [Stackebrandtia sp.]